MPRTDSASRHVAAPAEQVFAALVDPAALAAWLPPEGMSGRFEHADIRPGGWYRLVLSYDDPTSGTGKTTAGTDVVDSRIVDLVPGQRLVQEVDFVADDPAFAGTMAMTWSVAPADGGTLVSVRADGVPDGISAADHAVGLASSLANLAAYVGG
ncbi:SRPBCC family protein [Motilibacter aurantiacus]|uniref:SRPBCC family protein n=1 Tax=Motilibacter aurantiacus TaxID=2714955 RepID=UPI0014086AFD|nr:SRPBCC family protein [Motilibacter aurantiacus]